MKGFKAFNKGLKCKNFIYEVGKTYKTDEAKCCSTGFHFCENPLDTLNYYDLCESEFAEVEALGKIDDNKEDSKHATTEIKITAKIDLKAFIQASFKFIWESSKVKKENIIADSGNYSQVATSGYSSQVATSGYSSQVATSGNYSKVATSGYYSKVATSGNYSKVATSGDSSQVATSGDSSQVATSGYSSQVATSGYSSKVATSGESSKVEIRGAFSVGANIGINRIIKGKKGTWITLAQWEYDKNDSKWKPIFVKTEKIDGKKLKEDTFYKLVDKKFVVAVV